MTSLQSVDRRIRPSRAEPRSTPTSIKSILCAKRAFVKAKRRPRAL